MDVLGSDTLNPLYTFSISNDASLPHEYSSDFYRQLVEAIRKEKNEVLVSSLKEKKRSLTQQYRSIMSMRKACVSHINEKINDIQISTEHKILEIELRHERYQKNILNKRKRLNRKLKRLLFELYGEYTNTHKRFIKSEDNNRRKFDQDLCRIQKKREQYKLNSRVQHDFQTKLSSINKVDCDNSYISISESIRLSNHIKNKFEKSEPTNLERCSTDVVGLCFENLKISRDNDDINSIANQFSRLIDIRPITWLLDLYMKVPLMKEQMRMGMTRCTNSIFQSRVYFCLEEFMDDSVPRQSVFKNDTKHTQSNNILTYFDWANSDKGHLEEIYATSKLSNMEQECLNNKTCIPVEEKCNLHRYQNQSHPDDSFFRNFPDVLRCKADSSRHVHFAAATLMQLYQTGILHSSWTGETNQCVKDDKDCPERKNKPSTKNLYVAFTRVKSNQSAKREKNTFETILVKLPTSMIRELAIHYHTSFLLANNIHSHVHFESIFRGTSWQIQSDTNSQNHDSLCKNIHHPKICAWKTCTATAVGTKKRIFCNYHSNVKKITDTYHIDSSQKYMVAGNKERSSSSKTDMRVDKLAASSLLKELLNNSLQISLQEFFKNQQR